MNKYSTIRIQTTRNGKKHAYLWHRRWFRMSLAEAELAIANDIVSEVCYGPNPFQPYAKVVQVGTTPAGNKITSVVIEEI